MNINILQKTIRRNYAFLVWGPQVRILSGACVNVRATMKLLIRNLARTTTEKELRILFETFGNVQSCDLVLDKKSGGSKGFAFVEMPRPGEAKVAIKAMNGKEIDSSTIRVKYASTPSKSKAPANSSGKIKT